MLADQATKMRAVAMDKANEVKASACCSCNSVLQPTCRSFESLSHQLRGAECCDKMNPRCLVSLFASLLARRCKQHRLLGTLHSWRLELGILLNLRALIMLTARARVHQARRSIISTVIMLFPGRIPETPIFPPCAKSIFHFRSFCCQSACCNYNTVFVVAGSSR